MVRLGRTHLVLQAAAPTSKLPAAHPSSLGGVQGGNQQQGDERAESSRDRQQPALRVAGEGMVEQRDLVGGGVLHHEFGDQDATGDGQKEQEQRGHWSSSDVASPER